MADCKNLGSALALPRFLLKKLEHSNNRQSTQNTGSGVTKTAYVKCRTSVPFSLVSVLPLNGNSSSQTVQRRLYRSLHTVISFNISAAFNIFSHDILLRCLQTKFSPHSTALHRDLEKYVPVLFLNNSVEHWPVPSIKLLNT